MKLKPYQEKASGGNRYVAVRTPGNLNPQHIKNQNRWIVLVDVTESGMRIRNVRVKRPCKHQRNESILKGHMCRPSHCIGVSYSKEHFRQMEKESNEGCKEQTVFKKIMSHLQEYGWFYGALIQLVGTVVFEMIVS